MKSLYTVLRLFGLFIFFAGGILITSCETTRNSPSSTAAGDEVHVAQTSSGISGVQGDQDGEMAASGKKVRNYVVEDPERCKSIRFRCEPGLRPFFDKKGCGCEGIPQRRDRAVEEVEESVGVSEVTGKVDVNPLDVAPTRCSDASRRVTTCPEEGERVCGLFDPSRVQCIMAPCGRSFPNACKACLDEQIIAWKPGDCRPPAR